jgi:GTPase
VPGPLAATAGSKSDSAEDHAELDIIDSLGLADSVTHVRLKELLLASAESEDRLSQLTDILRDRLEEGNGETLFELGYENNGESMALTKDEWDIAMERLQVAAAALHAECRILITRNVGGEYEAETVSEKDKYADGKIMIRRKPDTAEDAIELRIAVVGNGTLFYLDIGEMLLESRQS